MLGRICSIEDALQMIGIIATAEPRNGAREGECLQCGHREASPGQSKPGSQRLVMRKAVGLPGAAGAKARQPVQAKCCSSRVV